MGVTDENPGGQMDASNLPAQQNQTQQTSLATDKTSSGQLHQITAKNVKNLSIKEFFTTRLMRARSFEGGGSSPKDETSNWFDEFKARMTKKSQAKQTSSSSGVGDDNNEDTGESSEGTVTTRLPKPKHHLKDDQTAHHLKENCDRNLGELEESSEVFADFLVQEDPQSPQYSSSARSKVFSHPRLRARKAQRISSTECPDFDTASIKTILNRRDSRYGMIERTTSGFNLARILNPLKRVITYLLPFNYDLPWKLMAFVNFTLVIIVIGLLSRTSPEAPTFSFVNGFICGIAVAGICVAIMALSLLMQILPSAEEKRMTCERTTQLDSSNFERLKTPNVSFIDKGTGHLESVAESIEPIAEDSSSFEVLGDGINRPGDGEKEARNESPSDDDDYKGWMIEFIGDYEQRNKSDIKLKLMFVRIENKTLYLCKPKSNHDAESNTFPVIVHQRIYNLNTARKLTAQLLLPKTVRNRQKWVWSKKYPIRLEFLEEPDGELSARSQDVHKPVQLTLFARSCREKEEWFRRFKRIVEDNVLAQGFQNKRHSLQSDLSGANDEAPLSSQSSFRGRSPSIVGRSGDGVKMSRSSHLLHDTRQATDEGSKSETPASNLIRTKSCELLNTEQNTSNVADDLDQPDDYFGSQFGPGAADDSTLTRETAEIFSQAFEYSNLMDSRPTLNYSDYIEKVIVSSQEATSTSDWFNALIGRIFFDVLSQNYWSVWFKRKIQRKLFRIRLPYFMETLTLTKIDLGANAPQFLNVVSHSVDSFGLSIDYEMAYSGGLTMTFETKLNLLKIKSDNSSTNSSFNPSSTQNQQSSSCTPTSSASGQSQPVPSQTLEPGQKDNGSLSESSSDKAGKGRRRPKSLSGSARTSGESSDSDESESESSSDSSCDEADVDEISDWEDYGAEKTRQSIVRFVDKIASSRYFQHATENRYIKKKLQDISNCPLVLVVQIQSLNGVLTVNVPPPQTNRLWYGFKPNPELTLKALPKMGDREVNLSHVTDWIERKLAEEFRKILVIPNMEDIVLPVLKSDHLIYVVSTK